MAHLPLGQLGERPKMRRG